MATLPPQLADIPGLVHCEITPPEQLIEDARKMQKDAYPHDEMFGDFCPIQSYIDCPPEDVFAYLCEVKSLEEYTVSTRDFEPTDTPGVYLGRDIIVPDTKIYMRLVPNREAMTLDYHCAWDQGDELWMRYFFRVLPAEEVLGKPGSVVTWINCHHKNYDKNPYPELAPNQERPWVGDLWDMFYAGHMIELTNLKRILEYRHANGLPILSSAQAEGAE